MTAVGRAGFEPRSCNWCGFTCWYYPVPGEDNWYCSHTCRMAQRTQTKRMRNHRVNVEPFLMWDVWYRDGFACAICRKAVDFELTEGDWRGTVDHIKPISRGGRHEFNNVRLAHKICNEARHWSPAKRMGRDEYDLALAA